MSNETGQAAAAAPAALAAPASTAAASGPADVPNNTRDRWHNRPAFVLSTVGASIGLGNIWKFPFLTFKHGGVKFIIAYLIAMFVVGIPMLLLELTLGQKMQRGSAGALRGIAPRLGGVGWAAAYSGFVTCLVYTILLGVCLVYLMGVGSQPWSEANLVRPMSCQTAWTMENSAAEIYLWMHVTRLWSDNTCGPFRDGLTTGTFAGNLYLATLVCWVAIFAALAIGPKALQVYAAVTVPLRFIFMIVLAAYFGGLNSNATTTNAAGESVSGQGMNYYLGNEKLPLPDDGSGVVKYRGFGDSDKTLFQDAYAQVFYSIGVCVGTMIAYGSYNKIKKPVILDSFLICFIDFLFAFISGFAVWGAIGYLQANGNSAYNQTNNLGLTFIGLPVAAALADNSGMLGLFCFTLWMSGIDSAMSYCEGFIANIMDSQKWPRWKAAAVVCGGGNALCLLFTSNWGWVLFDFVDHYMSSYIIIVIGLCQCISVGWIFERESTAVRSPEHRASLRDLALVYWFPTVLTCFYANFGFDQIKWLGVIIIFIISLIALYASFRSSKMEFIVWYHEIVMCGTDKVAMSITILQNETGTRAWWMLPFEFYFGILIKFVNPACLLFLFFEALQNDLGAPYGIAQGSFPALASIYVAVALILIIVPMFACDYPEIFTHNVEKEFSADDQFEVKERLRKKMEKMMRKKAKQAAKGAAGGVELAINKPQPPIEDPDKEDA